MEPRSEAAQAIATTQALGSGSSWSTMAV